ncbi:MAG TPA: YlbF family regulator [Candidatus Avimonas sp.]|jgi:cell fate (sporulation/competence/biofilm development) regulator YlbF (YheA/YmcA/DUF963 family)|nr:YlbF family regulator [Clostridiales bacterium]HOB35931.1 YlbF family regulator [Candidatus Avimonas sp.]HQA15337.1 YlbF family regulator [Candidatus Avimonas sp.]HQD37297.1 YlbF family regulator [Candidatus Avimonas sp.]
MDAILQMTQELAYKLQSDSRFIRVQLAQSAADQDEQLQKMIEEFNLKRAELSEEMAKEDREEAKIQRLDAEIREIYTKAMENENMKAYREAKDELDRLVSQMVTILTASARGEDPDSVQESGCGSSCAGCAGCH